MKQSKYLSQKYSNSLMSSDAIVRHILMVSISIKLIISHVFFFIVYCNEVLHETYYTTVLVGTVLSSFAIVIMIPTVIMLTVWRWKIIIFLYPYAFQ